MNKVWIINRSAMGEGDRELGETLMRAFLNKLRARDEVPAAMLFYNEGVKLLTTGSYVLDAFDALEQKGVQLLACGTCLNYYGLSDTLRIGQVSNMEEIVDYMHRADQVITL
ncbi:sulfurtransferase-like selenium metabolism protein YedF [Fusibacter sp. A1]|nr:sulfurtransferase-like selenium metabolism protein YedF [Fusibacter sp. A2]NPE22544.1 sulfurtransferase-like selenium metabolism protein YedF [Fusibacter sp. A1]RXV60646.1 sulfurtransferase-like selenium metabolism protein YedF [Fusibacter sp. A1]